MDHLDWQSDNLLELRGPVDETVPAGGDNAIDKAGGTVTGKLFNTLKDAKIKIRETTLSADEAAAQTVLSIQNTFGFADADIIHVLLDDGTIDVRTITGVPTATEITVTAGLTSDAKQGNKVRLITQGVNATHFLLDRMKGWKIGDVVTIEVDDDTFQPETVDQVIKDGTLVVAAAPAVAVTNGADVMEKIGADISFSAYGDFPTSNAVAGDETWGWRGTINHDHADLKLGMKVRVEFTLVETAINLFRKLIAVVVNA